MVALAGRALVAQSGGLTAVINPGACGVIETGLARPNVFPGVHGRLNAILGVLREELYDLGKEDPAEIEIGQDGLPVYAEPAALCVRSVPISIGIDVREPPDGDTRDARSAHCDPCLSAGRFETHPQHNRLVRARSAKHMVARKTGREYPIG